MVYRISPALAAAFAASWIGILAAAATTPTASGPTAPTAARIAVLSSAQVIEILDETVNWYRTLGAQQQSANQPSDLLILYANRQVATQVTTLAFDIARANAELLSSEASAAQSAAGVVSSAKSLNDLQTRLDAQSKQIQSELEAAQRQSGAIPSKKAAVAAKISALQGELAVVSARKNVVVTMSQFVNGSDAKEAGANALKAYIAAMQASIPSGATVSAPTLNVAAGSPTRRLGIWDLAANVLRVSQKLDTIDVVDKSTAALASTFRTFRATPLAQIQGLSAQSDVLASQVDSANVATTNNVRDQLDTLAWQFKQTAAIVVPLSKEEVLLQQYRHNLSGWRITVKHQYREALAALGVRVGVLLLILAALFMGAELWRRAVLRYEHELRRRHQWLLVRKITLWVVVVAVVGFTFVTQLNSVATFAGLITAGVAVAMQSVIVSIVGYFFLIGKYGVRVGDRVQIGDVTGEVVELGLVRMHLMELSSKGNFGPTGRIVAFANSIVFQASGGLFRQIPGVNFAWHDITLSLPIGIDYASAKDKMLAAVCTVVQKYERDMLSQTKQLDETRASHDASDAGPQVQLRFSSAAVEAYVRYPVYLPHAAEIDERVSEQLLRVISSLAPQLAQRA